MIKIMSSHGRILHANLALVLVGLADLATTMFWLHTGHVVEANPIMAAALGVGMWAFVAIKLSTLAAYVGVMEWYRRRRNPVFARVVGNITLCAYTAIYAVSFFCVNHKLLLG